MQLVEEFVSSTEQSRPGVEIHINGLLLLLSLQDARVASRAVMYFDDVRAFIRGVRMELQLPRLPGAAMIMI